VRLSRGVCGATSPSVVAIAKAVPQLLRRLPPRIPCRRKAAMMRVPCRSPPAVQFTLSVITLRLCTIQSCPPLQGACQVGMASPVAGHGSPVLVRVVERSRFLLVAVRPGFEPGWCRSTTAPATHRDQGDGISAGMIPALGAIRRRADDERFRRELRKLDRVIVAESTRAQRHALAHHRL
jgi:hypothetical protein